VGSSLKSSPAANDNLIDRTQEVWAPRPGRDLSREDARRIAADVAGFFTVLAEWSRAELPAPANDAGEPAPTDAAEVRREG
jgi:hypothetical protein